MKRLEGPLIHPAHPQTNRLIVLYPGLSPIPGYTLDTLAFVYASHEWGYPWMNQALHPTTHFLSPDYPNPTDGSSQSNPYEPLNRAPFKDSNLEVMQARCISSRGLGTR